MVQGGVADWRIAGWRETAHGRSSRVGRSLFERRARQIVVKTHHFWCWVASRRRSRVCAAGDHRRCGDGDARVLVHMVEASHAAVLAVLVFNNHSHGE